MRLPVKLRLWLVLAVSTALFGGSRMSRAADAGSQDLAAQQVVHLLEYVGSDYGGAVKKAKSSMRPSSPSNSK